MAFTQAETNKIDKISETVNRTDERLRNLCPIVHDMQETQQKHEQRISRVEWILAAGAFILTTIGGVLIAFCELITNWFKS